MRKSRLFRKTLLLMVLLFGVVASSSTVLSVWTLYEHMTDEYISKGRAIARSIASSSVEVLLNRDMSTIQSMIDQFLEIQGVVYVFVVDGEHEIISHTFVPQVPPEVLHLEIDSQTMKITNLNVPGFGDVIDVSKPILAGVAGHVHVGMDLGLVRSFIATTALRMQALMFFIFWGSVLLLYLVVRKISQPLNQLTDYAQRLRQHDFSSDIQINSKDEIGMLADTMRTMAREISSLIATLEQKVDKATVELSETLVYLEGIIDNMADGLLVVDTTKCITLNNPALLKQFGLPMDANLHEKRVIQFFPDEMGSIAEQCMLQPGEIFTAEVDLHASRFGKAVATSIRREKGDAPIGAVILVRDITAEKEVDQMKTDFITTVSHELRTPLTSVLGFAKIIKKKLENDIFPRFSSENDKQRRSLDQVAGNLGIIVSEGQRLTELINDVLDIAKMESGNIEWRMHKVSIPDTLEKAFSSTRSLYDEKGLDFYVKVPQDLPEIVADADRLIQVMVNLISNAVKFTDAGFIKCAAQLTEKDILFSVSDTGIGITGQDKKAVFERFRQAGSTMTEKPKGTGLGLPICREIVEYHGGRIWVESTPGKGSTFFFTIPIERPTIGVKSIEKTNLEAVCEPTQKLPPAQAPALVALDKTDKGSADGLLLVVDDDPSVCILLRQLLEAVGYDVIIANSGQEAIEMAEKHMPQLITMDLLMPGMDGETAITELRKNPLTRHIPVVVISAVLESRPQSNGDAALLKPVDEDALIQTVHGLLNAESISARHCLLLGAKPDKEKAQLVRLCSGSITDCPVQEIWSRIEEGFSGTVIISARACEHVNLSRLMDYQNVMVIILPD